MVALPDQKAATGCEAAGSYQVALAAFRQAEADNARLLEALAGIYLLIHGSLAVRAHLRQTPGAEQLAQLEASILDLLAEAHPGWSLLEKIASVECEAHRDGSPRGGLGVGGEQAVGR